MFLVKTSVCTRTKFLLLVLTNTPGTLLCSNHGGGVRCQHADCDKGAVGGMRLDGLFTNCGVSFGCMFICMYVCLFVC